MLQPLAQNSPLARVLAQTGTLPGQTPSQPPRQVPTVRPVQPPSPQFNPDRHALATALTARGMSGTGSDWGSVVGDLAGIIGGRIASGQERSRFESDQQAEQQRAQEEQASKNAGLARVLSGLGVDIPEQDIGVYQDNPSLMNARISQARQGATADPLTQPRDLPPLYNEAGESVLPGSWAEKRQLWSQGYNLDAAPGAGGEQPDWKLTEAQDGRQYWVAPGQDPQLAVPGAQAPVAGAPGEADAAPDVKGESNLRKEFDSKTQEFRAMDSAYGKIQAVAESPSAGGDIALIFNYMKMLDPGSVVRESEFATAQNAAGVPVQIRNKFNQLLTGERLSEVQRNDFLGQATNLYRDAAEGFNDEVERYRGLAGEYQYSPDRIAVETELPDPYAADIPGVTEQIRDLASGMPDFGALRGGAEENVDQAVAAVRDVLGNALPSGGQQPPPGANIKMRAPTGEEEWVPFAEVERMKSLGAVVVQ